jgi:hypothetical protein
LGRRPIGYDYAGDAGGPDDDYYYVSFIYELNFFDQFYEYDYEFTVHLHGYEYASRNYGEPGGYEDGVHHDDHDWFRREDKYDYLHVNPDDGYVD